MGKKDSKKKKRLAKADKKNRRIPPFIMLKTNRRVTVNRYRRNWRTDKLHIGEDD
jgi:large subunit ribosomal protein L39e